MSGTNVGKRERVLNVAQRGIPFANANGIFEDIDMVLITSSALRIDPFAWWVMKRKWQTMIADEGHDYLRGGGISP